MELSFTYDFDNLLRSCSRLSSHKQVQANVFVTMKKEKKKNAAKHQMKEGH